MVLFVIEKWGQGVFVYRGMTIIMVHLLAYVKGFADTLFSPWNMEFQKIACSKEEKLLSVTYMQIIFDFTL